MAMYTNKQQQNDLNQMKTICFLFCTLCCAEWFFWPSICCWCCCCCCYFYCHYYCGRCLTSLAHFFHRCKYTQIHTTSTAREQKRAFSTTTLLLSSVEIYSHQCNPNRMRIIFQAKSLLIYRLKWSERKKSSNTECERSETVKMDHSFVEMPFSDQIYRLFEPLEFKRE